MTTHQITVLYFGLCTLVPATISVYKFAKHIKDPEKFELWPAMAHASAAVAGLFFLLFSY